MEHVCIYFSSLQPDYQNIKEVEGGQNRKSHINCAQVDSGPLVPYNNDNVNQASIPHTSLSKYIDNAKQHKESAPVISFETDGLSIIREKFKREGVNKKLIKILMQGWRPSTLRQYSVYLNRWTLFCVEHSVDPLHRDELLALEFLRKLFKQGYGYSALNTARSALSTLFDNPPFGESPLVTRFMRSVYNIRPNLPRYNSTWDISVVLKYLEKESPIKFLSLQQLSHKLITLLAIVTGQRIQTLHALDLEQYTIDRTGITFTILKLLKHSKPSNKIHNTLTVKEYRENTKICPVLHIKHYIQRTKSIRKSSQLFINPQKPHGPISKDTLSRWIKLSLTKAGINTQKYKAHSTRAASTSAAAAASIDINKILQAASWTNASTFNKYYNKAIDAAPSSYGKDLLQKH